jgi:hypothetical protein
MTRERPTTIWPSETRLPDSQNYMKNLDRQITRPLFIFEDRLDKTRLSARKRHAATQEWYHSYESLTLALPND